MKTLCSAVHVAAAFLFAGLAAGLGGVAPLTEQVPGHTTILAVANG